MFLCIIEKWDLITEFQRNVSLGDTEANPLVEEVVLLKGIERDKLWGYEQVVWVATGED